MGQLILILDGRYSLTNAAIASQGGRGHLSNRFRPTRFNDFGTKNLLGAWCFDTNPDPITRNFDYGDHDIVTDYNSLTHFAA